MRRLCLVGLTAACLLVSLVPAASAALHSRFDAYSIGTDGTFNHQPAAGDFNGDGNVDLVTADAGTGAGSFSMLIGHGDGTFDGALVFDTPLPQGTVAVGDFDEDGLSDVVLRGSGNALTVLLSNGDETFADAGDFDMTVVPSWWVVGDFDGDGHDDLAAVGLDTTGAAIVAVRLGDGHGGFGAAAPYPVGATTLGVLEVGDFNGDGRDDVVDVGSSGDVAVLLSAADGSLSPATHVAAATVPAAAAVGRFNADARSDIAVSQAFADPLLLLLANADGSLATPNAIATAGRGGTPAIGDADGDGKQDVVVAAFSGAVTVLYGGGDGTFPRRQDVATAGRFNNALAFDANDDGFDDLGLVEQQTQTLIVAINSPWISASADALSFGALAPGSATAVQTVTVTNDGAPPLTIGAVAVRGADPGDFRVVSDGCVGHRLTAGTSCGLDVVAMPTAAGRRSADLVIESDAANGAKTLALTADGLASAGSGASVVLPRDTVAPVVTIKLLKQGLRRVIARGYQATVGCSEPCRFVMRLVVSRSLAHRLHIAATAPVAIAAATGKLAAPGRKKVVMKLTKRARSQLRGQRRLKLTLEVRATDAARNARTVRRAVLLGR